MDPEQPSESQEALSIAGRRRGRPRLAPLEPSNTSAPSDSPIIPQQQSTSDEPLLPPTNPMMLEPEVNLPPPVPPKTRVRASSRAEEVPLAVPNEQQGVSDSMAGDIGARRRGRRPTAPSQPVVGESVVGAGVMSDASSPDRLQDSAQTSGSLVMPISLPSQAPLTPPQQTAAQMAEQTAFSKHRYWQPSGPTADQIRRIIEEADDFSIAEQDRLQSDTNSGTAPSTSLPATRTPHGNVFATALPPPPVNDVIYIESSLTGDFKPIRRNQFSKDEQKPLAPSTTGAVDEITEMAQFASSARNVRNAFMRFVQGILAGVAATHAISSYGIFPSVDDYMRPAGLGVQRAFYILSTLALLGCLDLTRATSRSMAIAARICYVLCWICTVVCAPFDCIYGDLAVATTLNSGLYIGWSILNIARIAFALLGWFLLSIPVNPQLAKDDASIISDRTV